MLTASVVFFVLACTTYAAFQLVRRENPKALLWVSRPYFWCAVMNLALVFWVAFLILAFAMGIGDSGAWSNLPASFEPLMSIAGWFTCAAGVMWLGSPVVVLSALAKQSLPPWIVAAAFVAVVAPLLPLLAQAAIVVNAVSTSTTPATVDAIRLSKEIVAFAGGTVLFAGGLAPLVFWTGKVSAAQSR